ncbi:MAG: hypothetical protein D6805_04615 [Planctomycetota bacterium]|nr:MAG: hypothetical protein D6805_04615 [Planctomycetota bacterium]
MKKERSLTKAGRFFISFLLSLTALYLLLFQNLQCKPQKATAQVSPMRVNVSTPQPPPPKAKKQPPIRYAKKNLKKERIRQELERKKLEKERKELEKMKKEFEKMKKLDELRRQKEALEQKKRLFEEQKKLKQKEKKLQQLAQSLQKERKELERMKQQLKLERERLKIEEEKKKLEQEKEWQKKKRQLERLKQQIEREKKLLQQRQKLQQQLAKLRQKDRKIEIKQHTFSSRKGYYSYLRHSINSTNIPKGFYLPRPIFVKEEAGEEFPPSLRKYFGIRFIAFEHSQVVAIESKPLSNEFISPPGQSPTQKQHYLQQSFYPHLLITWQNPPDSLLEQVFQSESAQKRGVDKQNLRIYAAFPRSVGAYFSWKGYRSILEAGFQPDDIESMRVRFQYTRLPDGKTIWLLVVKTLYPYRGKPVPIQDFELKKLGYYR